MKKFSFLFLYFPNCPPHRGTYRGSSLCLAFLTPFFGQDYLRKVLQPLLRDLAKVTDVAWLKTSVMTFQIQHFSEPPLERKSLRHFGDTLTRIAVIRSPSTKGGARGVQTRKRNKKKGRLQICPFRITHPVEKLNNNYNEQYNKGRRRICPYDLLHCNYFVNNIFLT